MDINPPKKIDFNNTAVTFDGISDYFVEASEIGTSIKNDTSAQDSSADEKERVFMFFSVDLTNATNFKTMHPELWVAIFNDFYRLIEDKVAGKYSADDNCGTAHVWKYYGDEILFYVEITRESEIFLAPKLLHTAMMEAQAALHKEHPVSEGNLFFQGALWLAAATSVKNKKCDAPHNRYVSLSTGVISNLDFIGIDIDEGFRMAKKSFRGKISLDPKIAYFFHLRGNDLEVKYEKYKTTPSDEIKIIDYVKLKGVWEDKPFPVVWYTNNWGGSENDLYSYDEKHTNELIKAFRLTKDDERNLDKIKDVFSAVKTAESSYQKIRSIVDGITDPSAYVYLDIGREQKLTELHCSVVCVCEKTKTALVIQRAENDDKLGNCWDFGCATVRQADRYIDKIVRDYKIQLNIDIELLTDNSTQMPVPIGTFEGPAKAGIKKGIVFIARIKSGTESLKYDNTRYSSHKFITREQIADFENEKRVDDFSSSLNLAFDRILSK